MGIANTVHASFTLGVALTAIGLAFGFSPALAVIIAIEMAPVLYAAYLFAELAIEDFEQAITEFLGPPNPAYDYESPMIGLPPSMEQGPPEHAEPGPIDSVVTQDFGFDVSNTPSVDNDAETGQNSQAAEAASQAEGDSTGQSGSQSGSEGDSGGGTGGASSGESGRTGNGDSGDTGGSSGDSGE